VQGVVQDNEDVLCAMQRPPGVAKDVDYMPAYMFDMPASDDIVYHEPGT
jgi:hypothetical protein